MTKSAAMTLHAASALLPEGWASRVRLTLENGAISSVVSGVAAEAGDERHAVLVPAMAQSSQPCLPASDVGIDGTARARRRQLLELAQPPCIASLCR